MPIRSKVIIGKLRDTLRDIADVLHSSRGKDILIFLLFLCVSYVFWLIMALNDNTQRELHVPLKISDQPKDLTFISDVPATVQVSVRDRGSSLFSYTWGGMPAVTIPFKELRRNEDANRLLFSEQEMAVRVRSLFGASAQILSVHPDSLSLIYTEQPGRRVKVVPDIDASPSWKCVIAGPITVEPDSVTVYSVPQMASRIRQASTIQVSYNDLTETFTAEVRLKSVAGTRMEPDRVRVTVPVEPLIAKQRTVALTLAGAPSKASVVLFPSRVDVTYLVPMSMYNNEVGNITVVADYSKRSVATAKIPVYVGSAPDVCNSLSLAVDSVDYLLEQKQANVSEP